MQKDYCHQDVKNSVCSVAVSNRRDLSEGCPNAPTKSIPVAEHAGYCSLRDHGKCTRDVEYVLLQLVLSFARQAMLRQFRTERSVESI